MPPLPSYPLLRYDQCLPGNRHCFGFAFLVGHAFLWLANSCMPTGRYRLSICRRRRVRRRRRCCRRCRCRCRRRRLCSRLRRRRRRCRWRRLRRLPLQRRCCPARLFPRFLVGGVSCTMGGTPSKDRRLALMLESQIAEVHAAKVR